MATPIIHRTLLCSIVVLAALLLLHAAPANALVMTVRGCTHWAHGKCRGVWFQVGPGADCCGGALVRQVTNCSSSTKLCSADGSTGPVIGVYIDDTTPCPSSMYGAPGTSKYEGVSYGRPCVQYWVNYELQHNPGHGLIYAALPPNTYGKRPYTGATATLQEFYPFGAGSVGNPPKGRQGYILQRYFLHPRAREARKLWAWGMKHVNGVLAYY